MIKINIYKYLKINLENVMYILNKVLSGAFEIFKPGREGLCRYKKRVWLHIIEFCGIHSLQVYISGKEDLAQASDIRAYLKVYLKEVYDDQTDPIKQLAGSRVKKLS